MTSKPHYSLEIIIKTHGEILIQGMEQKLYKMNVAHFTVLESHQGHIKTTDLSQQGDTVSDLHLTSGCLGSGSGSAANSSSPLAHILQVLKYLGLCHSRGKSRSNFRLLTLAWPSKGCCDISGVTQQIEDLCLSLPFK